jgi:carbamoyl-phosphate synthase large subunit
MNINMLNILVTGAGGKIGVSMTRALEQWERETRIIGTEADQYYTYLSEADQTCSVPMADAESYADRLKEVVQSELIDVVLPSNGWEVNVISDLQQSLPARTVLPNAEAIDTFQDKWQLYLGLSDSDVPVPKTTLIESRSDIDMAMNQCSTDSVWVRGTGIKDLPGQPMEKKQLIANWIDYHDIWGSASVSSYLSGDDLTWLGVFDEGRLVCSQGRQRIDYADSASWGTGAPTISKTIHRDDVNQIGRLAIDAIEETPHGVYFTDMREDKEGTPRVTEVNPGRLGTTSVAFYLKAGLNLTALLCQIALEEEYESKRTFDTLSANQYYITKSNCKSVIIDGKELDIDDA